MENIRSKFQIVINFDESCKFKSLFMFLSCIKTGSQILKVWRSFMEEWEQTAKQFKSNAEFLESLCQDKLTHLYQDKRKARKNYQEEHQKIATQFTNVS